MGEHGIRYKTVTAIGGIAAIPAMVAVIGLVSPGGGRTALAQMQTFSCDPPTQIFSDQANNILYGNSGEAFVFVGTCWPGRVSEFGHVTASQGGTPVAVAPMNVPEHGFRLFPCNLPAGSDLPGAKLTVTFDSRNRAANKTETLTLAPDMEKPTLKTTSQPPKGTKVNPGDRIIVRMEASEEYGDARRGWQSGIKKIQLRDESLNRDVPPYHVDNGPMRPCAQKPWKQQLEVTYVVPPNPPPVIRLRATAWDFAGNKDDDVGEFPTGDWVGTFTYEGVSVAAVKSHASADIVLNHDGQGNLRGTMVGQHQIPAGTSPNGCSWQPGQPNRFRVTLVGSHTEGRSFKVFIENVVEDTGIKYMLQCSGIPIPVALERAFFPYAWGYKAFLGTPSPLGEGEVLPNGNRQYKFGSPSGPGPAWTVTLRRARN
jgi:hypothetical protein